jgi:diguanylate cyclase (GGDEF)-like protein/PAS domain S-box-containing protein
MGRRSDTSKDEAFRSTFGRLPLSDLKAKDRPSRRSLSQVLRRELLDGLLVFVIIFSCDGILLEINEPALSALGMRRKDVVGKPLDDELGILILGREQSLAVAGLMRRAAAGESVRAQLTARFEGGRTAVLDCLFKPIRDAGGRIEQIAATGVEITPRIEAEFELMKANRELRLHAGCNQLLVRAQSEHSLLKDLCRMIVEDGGYRFAWVGFALGDMSVSPVASASADTDADADAAYLANSNISWADTQLGRGPTGRAIRERRIEVCRSSDPWFEPWRSKAARRKFESSIALPLITDQVCIGALNVYSDRRDAFDEAEVALLRELSLDLAYGIGALRARAERQRAREQVDLFRTLLQHTSEMIYVVDADTGRILDANESGADRLGYLRTELMQLTLADLSAPQPDWKDRVDYIRVIGTLVSETRYRTKSGDAFPVEYSTRYVELDRARYLIVVARDITERRRDREQIERLARILRMQSGINSAVLRIHDRDELLQEACRLATEVGGYDRAVLSVVDASGTRAIPKYRAGTAADFPEPAELEIRDSPPDTSLSARALRTGKVAMNKDLTQPDPPVATRDRLLELGFRAMVAVPLIVDGRREAVLMLVSRDRNLIADEELLLLLQDMMASLAFALRSKQHAEAAQFLAYYDPLTGLAKRPRFSERLDELLHQETPPRKLAVIAIDVRGLNRINDTFGRHFGDLVLLAVAERLKIHARGEQRVGHFGGGTFGLVEPPLTGGEESIRSVLEANLFAEPIEIEGRSLRISCNYGVSHCPDDGTDAGTLVQRAEAALGRARESGEGYVHYRLEMRSQTAERLDLEHKLNAAIARHQFELYYQAQVDCQSDRIGSLEALIRWNDPASGVVAPARFLGVLESTGMILAVGEWVLERAVSDCERWWRMGLAPLRVAVNVSALQLRQRNFVQKVLKLLQRLNHCKGFGLDLEITETALLQDLEGAGEMLKALRAAGVRIALDDFGTGYSSLGLLSKLPLDLLKIDRSFVAGIPHDASSVAIVENILRLASVFRLITVGEGVETAEQLRALKSMRCDQWQGYLHGPPVPALQIEPRLARG